MLDIIVPHYKESWDVVHNLFDMLNLQRDVDFNKISVYLVNDGIENEFPAEYFENRPYHVEQISIPHAGVSTARNTGLKAATREWVMFCDCDDMFSNVYSLREYLNVLPAPEYDILWAEFYSEDSTQEKTLITPCKRLHEVFPHGKVYRRKYLLDNDIWFNTELAFNEDSEFNAIALNLTPYKRIGKIVTHEPPYIWMCREGSTTHSRPDRHEVALCDHYKRNISVCKVFKEKVPNHYNNMVARTVLDTFYTLNIPVLTEKLQAVKTDFAHWFQDHKKAYYAADKQLLPEMRRMARMEYKSEDFRDDITLDQWLVDVERSIA